MPQATVGITNIRCELNCAICLLLQESAILLYKFHYKCDFLIFVLQMLPISAVKLIQTFVETENKRNNSCLTKSASMYDLLVIDFNCLQGIYLFMNCTSLLYPDLYAFCVDSATTTSRKI